MKIKNKEIVVAKNLGVAKSFSERLKGLMFVAEMPQIDALLIEKCNSIHTCFMKFSLDVLFIDKKNNVVAICKNIRPWRMSRIYFSAVKVLELPAGGLDDGVKVGDQLEIECLS